tara:strand:+ start:755 stop:1042 length:288 start_codon:yes stop_codon:yes gene_type:complete
MIKITFVSILALISLPVWAKPQTVNLDLPTMNCAMCPITVKKALTKVKGVIKAEVSYEHKQAVVTFEDTQTDTNKLIEATTNAGYPSTIVETAAP